MSAVTNLVEMPRQETPRRERGQGSIFQQSGSRNFWFQYYDANGKRIRESAGTDVRRVAESKLRQRLGQREAGTLPDKRAEKTTIAELAETFLLDYRNNGKDIEWAERCWNHLKPTFENMRASRVSTDDVQRYIAARIADGASNATINRERSALRRMFTLGQRSTPPKVARIPIFPPKLRESDPRAGFVEDEQYAQIVAQCEQSWLRALVAVAYSFGFRKAELLNMRVRQIDLKARTIRLEPGTTKNKDGRTVVMTAEVHRLLSECVKGKAADDAVFTWPDGSAVLDFRAMWGKVTAAANLPGLLLHDFRRSAVRNMVRRGVPELVAMKISGHKTRSVFDRYNVTSESDLAEAARRIEAGRVENGHSSAIVKQSGSGKKRLKSL